MKTITVSASKEYRVMIGSDLLSQLGTYTAQLKKPCKAAIISDSNVWPLYGSCAQASLVNAGFETVHFVFPAGEESKNPATYFTILNFLADNHLTRSDLVIALGGGVSGDMTGFAAASYLSGISYIQVATSLLAMVDSSVVGKTAIDLPAGKNLVGAFYQPILVLCDIDTLSKLPEGVFHDGCAEVIKYGILYDMDLFNRLAEYGLNFHREDVIARCVELKRNVVMEDEFDTGSRQKLNLGHTIGHAIEAQSDFTVSHGQAVAMGMSIVAKASNAISICDCITACKIESILEQFGLPTKTDYTAQQILLSALSDKKRSGGTVHLIVPKAIGNCIIHPMPVSKLQSFNETRLL